MRNTNELHKLAGKRAKGKTSKVSPSSVCLKNGSNTAGSKHPEMDAERRWGRARYHGGTKHLHLHSSPCMPAAPVPPQDPGAPFSSLPCCPVPPPLTEGKQWGTGWRGGNGCRNAASAQRLGCQPPEHFPAREQIRGKR